MTSKTIHAAKLPEMLLVIFGFLIWPTPTLAGYVSEAASSLNSQPTTRIETNISVSSLQQLLIEDPINEDEAYSKATLNAPMGTATLSGHACSGGLDTGLGQVNVTGIFFSSEKYRITSSTLPI